MRGTACDASGSTNGGHPMSAISNTSMTMPKTAATGGGGAATQLPGATITSSGGATTLPAASASDFATADNPLSQPDSTYPSLELSHVAVFRAIGTPEDMLAQLASEQPDAATIDAYIMDEIMQNPEAWDQRTGQPTGTARAGLTQLMPGQPLGGTARASGVAPPAIFTPTTGTQGTSGGGGLVTKLLVGAGVVGVGAGAFFLGRKNAAAKAAEAGAQALNGVNIQQLGMMAPDGLGGLGGLGTVGAQSAAHAAFNVTGGGSQLHNLYTANMANLAMQAGDASALKQAVLLDVIANGNLAPLDKAAAMHGVMEGMGVVDPGLSRIFQAGDVHGVDPQAAMDGAIRLGIGDKLDSSALAHMLTPQAGATVPDPNAANVDGALNDLALRLAFLRASTPTT